MSPALEAFLKTWRGSGGNERANKDSFFRDFCRAGSAGARAQGLQRRLLLREGPQAHPPATSATPSTCGAPAAPMLEEERTLASEANVPLALEPQPGPKGLKDQLAALRAVLLPRPACGPWRTWPRPSRARAATVTASLPTWTSSPTSACSAVWTLPRARAGTGPRPWGLEPIPLSSGPLRSASEAQITVITGIGGRKPLAVEVSQSLSSWARAGLLSGHRLSMGAG